MDKFKQDTAFWPKYAEAASTSVKKFHSPKDPSELPDPDTKTDAYDLSWVSDWCGISPEDYQKFENPKKEVQHALSKIVKEMLALAATGSLTNYKVSTSVITGRVILLFFEASVTDVVNVAEFFKEQEFTLGYASYLTLVEAEDEQSLGYRSLVIYLNGTSMAAQQKSEWEDCLKKWHPDGKHSEKTVTNL